MHIFASVKAKKDHHSHNKVQVVYSCLIIPILIGLWWLYTKRTARRVAKRISILWPSAPYIEESACSTRIYKNESADHGNLYIQHCHSLTDDLSVESVEHSLHDGLPILTRKDCYSSWNDLVSEQEKKRRTPTGLVKWLDIGKRVTRSNMNNNQIHSSRRSRFNFRHRSRDDSAGQSVEFQSSQNSANYVPETEFIIMQQNQYKTQNCTFDGSDSICHRSNADCKTNSDHHETLNHGERWQCIPDTLAAVELCVGSSNKTSVDGFV